MAGFLAQEGLSASYRTVIDTHVFPIADRLAAEAENARVVGIAGPQGSGKSTLASALAADLAARGLRVATLSLDDLYLAQAARRRLARSVHPLFVTRGPPGTHDLMLGHAVLDSLAQPGPTALPRFSKADDDPAPQADWPCIEGPADLIILEGWCLGAPAEPEAALEVPVNTLEADEDPAGVWRRHVNAQLAGPYADFFARLDRLIYLAPPGFETVLGWRREQEAKLRARLAAQGRGPARTMDDAALARFIQHYERITRAMLRDLPGRADAVISLAADRMMSPPLWRPRPGPGR